MSVRIERDGFVTTVTIDRPQARNAVDPATAEALYDAFIEFDRDEAQRVAVFTGTGGAFCAGWDLKHGAATRGQLELTDLAYPVDRDQPLPRGPMGPSRLVLSKPVIAAIEGPAVAGGMELALWCDLRVMGRSAYLGVYCRRWGVPLIDGGTVRLPRIVGMGRALDLILTGRKVAAEECHAMGLANRVVDDGEALTAARSLAADISRFPQECMRADRRSTYAQHDHDLREAMMHEWWNAVRIVEAEGADGAARFASGIGRHGDFSGHIDAPDSKK